MVDTTTQEAVRGWDQQRIRSARIALVGTGPLAQFTLLYLVAASFGSIRIFGHGCDDEQNDFLIPANRGRERPIALVRLFSQCNIETVLSATPSWVSPLVASNLTLLVDATNDPYSKEYLSHYARKYSLPFISAAASNTLATVVSVLPEQWREHGYSTSRSPYLLAEFTNRPQGIITSSLAAGLTIEATRKIACPFGEADDRIDDDFLFNLRTPSFLGSAQELEFDPAYNYRSQRALVVGAGALGNSICLGLARLGFGNVDVLDYKRVDPTNLCRQPLFLFGDWIGERKADAICTVLNEYFPKPSSGYRTVFSPIYGKLAADLTSEEEEEGLEVLQGSDLRSYTLIFSCVDNNLSRAMLDRAAREYGIPLTDGAVTDTRGLARISIESYTPPLIKQELGALDAPSPIRTEVGCASRAHTPAVGYINPIVTALMLSLATRHIQGESALPTPLHYNSFTSMPINAEVLESAAR